MTDEKNEIPRIQQTGEKLPINKDTLDIIVANIIPSSKYFEARFDHLEHRVISIEADMKDFRSDVDKRFIRIETDMKDFRSDVDKRFIRIETDIKDFRSDVDKRFNESRQYMDKRFDDAKHDMDKRFDDAKHDNNERFNEMIQSIDRLSANLQDRDKEQRGFTLKLFSIAFVGVLGVALKLFVA